MHEILQEVLAYLRSMWRYRWYTMGLVWLVSIIGWIGVVKLPNQYSASARVHVDTESVLRPLMRGLAIEPNVTQRLNLMTRTLLSRPNMEKLARMTDMDIKANTPREMDLLLTKLAKGVKLANTDRNANIYKLRYTSTDPELSKNVVQNILNILSESTLGQSRENSDAAQRFLRQQISQYEEKLSIAEDELKEFKRKNRVLMPTLSKGYFQSLQNTENVLDESRLELREATRGRDELKRQLTGEEPVFGIASDSHSTPILSSTIDIRIQELQKQRDELLLQYTEQHPQIVSIQETITSLERRKKASVDSGAPRSIAPLEQNPVYQQIRIALAQAEARVSSLTVRVREYASKVTRLKQMVHQIPDVENELKRLERRHELARTKYNEFVEREETAKLSEQVEQAGEGVKIKVIDPPYVSNEPSGPNRTLLFTMVLVASLGVGLGLAFILSQLKPVVHDARALRHLTGLPIYGSVSRIWTPELLRIKRIEYGSYAGIGLLLFMTYAVLLMIPYTAISKVLY